MEDENIVYENINPEDDNERYFLTPWGCLCCAFGDFGLKPPEISGRWLMLSWMISLRLWKQRVF